MSVGVIAGVGVLVVMGAACAHLVKQLVGASPATRVSLFRRPTPKPPRLRSMTAVIGGLEASGIVLIGDSLVPRQLWNVAWAALLAVAIQGVCYLVPLARHNRRVGGSEFVGSPRE